MKRIFLDTNIVIDYLAKREPFAEDAYQLFSKGKAGKYKLCISSLSFTTIFYVLKKICEHGKLMELLEKLQSLSEVLPVNAEIIQSAIESDFTDFEDAVQYYSATAADCQVIITRNAKDFITANIPVYTPAEFLNIQD